MATALITGGTSGIGAAFARQLAARGTDIVLVARNRERLEKVAAELHAANGINVETISADLSDRKDVATVAARLEDPNRPIDILVNNAGAELRAKLTASDTTPHERAFDVMVLAVLVLGGAAGRAMSARGSGTIINISSLQSWLTTGSYGAIKAWVTAYSQGLSVELRKTGVAVTVVLPGWVDTEWHAIAGTRRSTIPAWAWTDPDVVARESLRDAERGRAVSIPTLRYRVLGWFARHLPLTTIRWISAGLASSRTAQQPAPASNSIAGSEQDGMDAT